jgi:hypothetical protein
VKGTSRKQDAPGAPPRVDPALVPFLDTLAALLAAQERRLADGRRALQEVAQPNSGETKCRNTKNSD